MRVCRCTGHSARRRRGVARKAGPEATIGPGIAQAESGLARSYCVRSEETKRGLIVCVRHLRCNTAASLEQYQSLCFVPLRVKIYGGRFRSYSREQGRAFSCTPGKAALYSGSNEAAAMRRRCILALPRSPDASHSALYSCNAFRSLMSLSPAQCNLCGLRSRLPAFRRIYSAIPQLCHA